MRIAVSPRDVLDLLDYVKDLEQKDMIAHEDPA
jgi:hypothetical protein